MATSLQADVLHRDNVDPLSYVRKRILRRSLPRFAPARQVARAGLTADTFDCTKRRMARIRATASDVARLAGVDPSTVSRVLNRAFDHHSYATETVDRVRRAAKKLGYRPSLAARGLRTGRTMLLGMVVSDIASPFFAELAARVERRARRHKYRLIVCNTDENPRWQAEHLAELISHPVDGLIVSPTGSRGCRRAVNAGVPMVTIDRRLPLPSVPHVGLNNLAAGRMLGEHLRDSGRRRVAVVMPSAKDQPVRADRLEGLRQGLAPTGSVVWVQETSVLMLHRSTRAQLRRRLEQSDPAPDAIVGLTQVSTLSAMEVLTQSGIAFPEQMALAGIDDFPAAALMRPAVTVVAQPIDQIAAAALDALIRQIASPDQPVQSTTLKPSLIERDSV